MTKQYDNTIWLTITKKVQYNIYTMYNTGKGQDFRPWTWKNNRIVVWYLFAYTKGQTEE